jgi:hypothetical protein
MVWQQPVKVCERKRKEASTQSRLQEKLERCKETICLYSKVDAGDGIAL